MPARKSAEDGGVFSEEERAAMRELVEERKRAKSRGPGGDGEADVLAKIAEMKEPDRTLAERIHALVKANAPTVTPRTWYGMPAYARDGNVVCYFQSGQKFKARYATLGFSDKARLDDGDLWPVVFALKTLTPALEKRVGELIRKAVG